MSRVLVVDDEPQILRALRITLEARSYQVTVANNGAHALAAAASFAPDVIVLDLGLPDMDGTDVICELRKWTSVPVIILSGRSQSAAKVRALEAGADDYVTKPFDVDELIARVRAVSRRAAPPAQAAPVRLGEYLIDIPAHRISYADDPSAAADVRLTRTEWQLLQMLVDNPGRLVTQRHLLQAIRGPKYNEETHYVRQFMAQLRRKLERDPARPCHLLTEPGMGYRFEP